MHMVDEWFHDPRGPYQYALNAIEHAGGFHKQRVLEVGCGPGRFLSECRQRGATITGIDRSPTAVRLAKQYFDLDLVPKTLEEVMHEGGSPGVFDLIFAFEIIEHVSQPAAFIQLLSGLLAPDGQLFVSTPNFHLFTLMGNAAPAVRQWPEHLHFFDPPSLARCLERGSGRVVHCTTLSPMSSGDRQKQVLNSNPAIARVWRLARRVKRLVAWKDKVFARLARRQQEADTQGLTGTCVLGVVGKVTPPYCCEWNRER
jgi:2-polyprenyl-6-hydroxyphenyl methylase / 3-demethylubiquinone-9 3-methyltransferase